MADETVEAVMEDTFVSLSPKERLDLADDIMKLGRVRHLPVQAEGGRLVGVVSQRDLLAAGLSAALEFGGGERRSFLRSVAVDEVMTRDPVTVTRETPLREAAARLLEHKIGCLPVVAEGDALVGLVTETDLLRAAYPPAREC